LSGRKVFDLSSNLSSNSNSNLSANSTQPKQIKAHVAGSFSAIREGVCNFIVCCYAEAARAKCQQLPNKGDLLSIVRYAVNCEVEQNFVLTPAMSPLEYVAEVAEPSLLSDIQTLLLKVNPYDLRKQAERIMILALAGKTPLGEAKARLENNLKTAAMAPFLTQAARLRSAVIDSYRIGGPAAAEKHKVAEFEINYVRMKCDSKTKETNST
jgi:hypothetical protein